MNMNVFRPQAWKQFTGIGRRFYRAKDIESNPTNVPTTLEEELGRARWEKSYTENDLTFTRLLKSFHRKKDEPKKVLQLDDFKYDNLRMLLKSTHKQSQILDQSYMLERHQTLGNELAAAHFIVYRGGRVKFYGQDYWIKTLKGRDYYESLPKQFDPSVFLEAVDVSGVKLYYEGIENLKGIARLRWLSVSGSPLIDDWSLDRIVCLLKDTLEHLDISNCKKVTHRGISCLYKMEKLKTLKVDNIADSLEFQLSCLMLEDANPNISIEGVKYLAPEDKNIQSGIN